jgi:hypothetical protein
MSLANLKPNPSKLVAYAPFGDRDETAFLDELKLLTEWHHKGCPEYARVVGDLPKISSAEQIPYLHTGLFKRLELKTAGSGLKHGRKLQSSGTGGMRTTILLDDFSSELQAKSAAKILENFLGEGKHPLIILDNAGSLRNRGMVSARVAAATALLGLASSVQFVLRDPDRGESIDWAAFEDALRLGDNVLVYGITWMLWEALCVTQMPQSTRALLQTKTVTFVHSGGWKKLESKKVDESTLRGRLKELAKSYKLVDYYGMAEQPGLLYPLCEVGFRHIAIWADIVIRDIHTHRGLIGEVGQIQLLNSIAYGAPYNSVLTEDLGKVVPGPCPCGRKGKRFELVGRIPRAEIRGCANV